MGCAASKAPQKRDPVEELIEEVHAQQGRESGGGVTLDDVSEDVTLLSVQGPRSRERGLVAFQGFV